MQFLHDFLLASVIFICSAEAGFENHKRARARFYGQSYHRLVEDQFQHFDVLFKRQGGEGMVLVGSRVSRGGLDKETVQVYMSIG